MTEKSNTAAEPSTMPDHTQTESCYLMKLPAGLRNDIYELVFNYPDTDTKALFAPVPISKSLVLTCRRLHREAVEVYKRSYREYWSTSTFVTTDLTRAKGIALLPTLEDRDVCHIRSLTMTSLLEDEEAHYEAGIWHTEDLLRFFILCGKSSHRTAEEDLYDLEMHDWSRGRGDKTWDAIALDDIAQDQAAKVEAYARGKALSLYELEGAMFYFLRRR